MNLLRNPLVDRLPLIVEPWPRISYADTRLTFSHDDVWTLEWENRNSTSSHWSQKFFVLLHYFDSKKRCTYINWFYFEISIIFFIITILIYICIIIISSSRSFRPRISFEFWTWRHLVLTGRELTYNRNRGFDGSFDIDCSKWIFSA